ncbi:sporulation membrane protein YtaF [Rossellomorea vietnamensis]|uniref:Sporulation membrane protein YtaF n=2 Tax=Rossellomorea TaxID=2837508 RepID=A0A5D4KI51_9BACI|nr:MULTISPECIES: sporulation membrane protein YtaF [Rossellomorea]TYR76921.1 sporulation membrane protein YtaF [Rossellomorea vietnamensis]TYS84135.1 sporulation membrane protein YtaF [Rossellomorea aquimaris]
MGGTLLLFMLAFAVSLDSFSTGLTYGLRKMGMPLRSIVIISVCSAGSLLAAMSIGSSAEGFLSEGAADRIGGLILIAIGAFVLLQFFTSRKDSVVDEEKILFNFEIESIGLVINILKRPMAADFDRSGTITGVEAIMLGLALSLDAFGAGIGAALLGYSPLLLAFSVMMMSIVFLSAGLRIGKSCAHMGWVKQLSFLPGVLLILIGVLRF